MITFTIALVALILGYIVYGRYVNTKLFIPDETRKTPALTMTDGVDFIPLPTWKIFMIQFLNIAGLGPIFGAIMGAQFGTASYLWIVFGTIFAGAVHDFLSGTLSLRNGGESLPQIIGRYLGGRTQKVACVFTVLLMILVGAVFVSGPAELLAGMTPDSMNVYFWVTVIFIYYVLATMLPVDKIIGRVYPLFAFPAVYGCRHIGDAIRKEPRLARNVERLRHQIRKEPHLPDDVHLNSLRSHQRIPRYTVALDGTLHHQRETLSPYLLRSYGNRRSGSVDLGCRGNILLP